MNKPSINFKSAAMAQRKKHASGLTQSSKNNTMKSSSFFNMLEKVKNTNKTRKFKMNLNFANKETGVIASIDTSRSKFLLKKSKFFQGRN